MSAVGTAVLQAPVLRQQVRDYVALTKPRVISLLLVTALRRWWSRPRAGPQLTWWRRS